MIFSESSSIASIDGRLERDLRVVRDVEEVVVAQVLVPAGLTGVDRRGLDLAVGLGAREVVADVQRALELGELAAHGGECRGA